MRYWNVFFFIKIPKHFHMHVLYLWGKIVSSTGRTQCLKKNIIRIPDLTHNQLLTCKNGPFGSSQVYWNSKCRWLWPHSVKNWQPLSDRHEIDDIMPNMVNSKMQRPVSLCPYTSLPLKKQRNVHRTEFKIEILSLQDGFPRDNRRYG